jgi:hypothetical protein
MDVVRIYLALKNPLIPQVFSSGAMGAAYQGNLV